NRRRRSVDQALAGTDGRARGLLHAHQLEVCLALGYEPDETANLRVDRFAESAPAEYAVVPQSLRQQVLALVGRNVAAEGLGGFGLAVSGNIVQFTLDGEQSRLADCFRLYEGTAHPPLSFRQLEILKHDLDGIEVVLCRHV